MTTVHPASHPTDGPVGRDLRRRFLAASNRVWIVVAWAWLLVVGTGFVKLLRYATTPGVGAAAAGVVDPRELGLDATRPTLLLFLHPQCPCSRATLHELERVIAGSPAPFRTRVLFWEDPARAEDWSTNELWRAARAIRGAETERDRDGRLARALDVHTSGQALLFAPNGRLEFSGGLTGARGHEGPNENATAVLAILAGETPEVRAGPVFGCRLTADDAGGAARR